KRVDRRARAAEEAGRGSRLGRRSGARARHGRAPGAALAEAVRRARGGGERPGGAARHRARYEERHGEDLGRQQGLPGGARLRAELEPGRHALARAAGAPRSAAERSATPGFLLHLRRLERGEAMKRRISEQLYRLRDELGGLGVAALVLFAAAGVF